MPPTSIEDTEAIENCAARLLKWFAEPNYIVALSGGVDSCVVAYAAFSSGKACLAVTSNSPSVPREDIQAACSLAEQFGFEHQLIATDETLDADYIRNDQQRCYYCKSHLYSAIESAFPSGTIVNGTNFDDLGDYRPGLKAARENRVRSPLLELKIGKRDVRRLAKYWELPTHEKPASPCLASRIAYGVEVTHERLSMIENAEQLLRQLGLQELRVRLHPDNLARIEVPVHCLAAIIEESTREQLLASFRDLGFQFVTLDIAGFESGSLNRLVQLSVD